MAPIQDIKSRFDTPEAFAVFSDCMYLPSWEKFSRCARGYVRDTAARVLGYLNDGHIAGILVLRTEPNGTVEIRGIAVHPACRRHGIGGQLIEYACHQPAVQRLCAETDDDAVEFYRRCGFQTVPFYREGTHGRYRRYACARQVGR